MLEFEEIYRKLQQMKTKLLELGDSLNIFKLEEDLKKLEEQTTIPDFWNDSKNSSAVLKQINNLKSKTEEYKKISTDLKDTIELIELLKLEADEQCSPLQDELNISLNKLEKDIEKLEINTLLSGKYDINNAIITLHPGAGGTESCDWAQMLYRMYTRWATANGYEVKELDYLDGEEAGIKSVTALISGPYAYGYLKGEMGVHRLVRISPFDSGGRRHTSFASLEVLPEITEDIEIDINPDDLRIDTYRASRSRWPTYKQNIFSSKNNTYPNKHSSILPIRTFTNTK